MIINYLAEKIAYIHDHLSEEEYDSFHYICMKAKSVDEMAKTIILYKRSIDAKLEVL